MGLRAGIPVLIYKIFESNYFEEHLPMKTCFSKFWHITWLVFRFSFFCNLYLFKFVLPVKLFVNNVCCLMSKVCSNICNFIQHYLKKDSCHKCFFFNRFTRTPHPLNGQYLLKHDKSFLLVLSYTVWRAIIQSTCSE